MQFINYFLSSIIAFSGLAIGMILITIAPEEQKPLQKYFNFAEKIILMLIFIFLFFYYYKNNFYFFTILFYLIFVIFVEYKTQGLRKSIFAYSTLGILFFLGAENTNLFAIESSLILLYGVIVSSLLFKKKEKNYFSIVFYNAGFLVISNLLFLIK